LIKLTLMPITSQNDLLLNAWQSHHINQGHWNNYAHITELYKARNFVSPHPAAPYPYGFYALTAVWLETLRLVGLISYEGWTTQWAITNRALWFLLLKLPYLAADIVIGVLLFKSARARYGPLAWATWAWSGSAAYLLLMGQNDLYPTLFTVSATVLGAQSIRARRAGRTHGFALSVASMIMLGIGATFKIIPLALVAPFALTLTPHWRHRALLVSIPALIFGASALPFLSTPAFVNGVLFNWEGVRLFSAIQIFANPVSLFVMSYVALLVFLICRPYAFTRPRDLWLIGAAVFSSLFLFSWSQFYWAVWLTPFIVALIAIDTRRARYWAVLWLILEIAFSILLFNRHRDFNIGLLAAMSLLFRFAQLDTVVALFAPAVAQPLEILWTVTRTAQSAAWLLILAGAIGLLLAGRRAAPKRRVRALGPTRPHQALQQPVPARWAVILLLPAIAAALGAAGVFTLSRNASVREFQRAPIGQLTLTADTPAFSQTMAPLVEDVTGLLLDVSLSESIKPPAKMELCAQPASAAHSPICTYGSLIQTPQFQGYGFILSPPLPTFSQPYTLTFRLVDPATDARVSTVIVSAPQTAQGVLYNIHYAEQAQNGLAALTVLRAFDTGAAFSAMADRLGADWRLFIIWGLSLILCLIIIGRCVRATSPAQGTARQASDAPQQP